MSDAAREFIVARFEDERRLIDAVRAVRARGLRVYDVYAPYAIHGLDAFATTPSIRSLHRTFVPPARRSRNASAWVNDTGLGVIGTPDEAIRGDPTLAGPVGRIRLLSDDGP